MMMLLIVIRIAFSGLQPDGWCMIIIIRVIMII